MNNLTIPMTLSIDSPIPLQLQQQVVPRLSMTNELKTALLQIAEKVAYIDDNGQQYYQDLYDALYPPAATYTITNTLTGCTSSNSAVAITEGDSYTATITASSSYSLTGATVSITMGGSDITASAYNAGTISIASVAGDLSITVTAVAVTVSSISAVYTQSGTVFPSDSLDSLKSDLVVTATWSDTSTSTVASADYTLSGSLTAGTSTITVTYQSKTTTFTVTVTSYVTDGLIMWLDGERNSTSGSHATTLSSWIDQTGNEWDWENNGKATVSAKSVVFDGTAKLTRAYQSVPQNVAMIEIVAKKTTGGCILTGFGRNYLGNINIPSSGNNITFHTGSGSGSSNNTSFDFGTAGAVHSANSGGYLDGTVVQSYASSSADWQYQYPCIGMYRAQNGTAEQYPFNGEIYCIRLYSKVLTEQEILANYAIDAARFGIGA